MLPFAHLGLALFIARALRRADLAFLAPGSMLTDMGDLLAAILAVEDPYVIEQAH